MFSTPEIIDIAIQLEKNSEKIYRDARKRIDGSALQDLLEWVAAEEIRHAEWLTALKNEIELRQDHHLITQMSEILSRDYIGGQVFSLEDVDFSRTETTEELIQIFINFEKDTIMFYEMLKSFIIVEETAEKLNQIIDEEKNHIKKFQELSGNISGENRQK